MIDDFQVGPFAVVDDPVSHAAAKNEVVGIDPAHVVGGARYASVHVLASPGGVASAVYSPTTPPRQVRF